MAKFNRTVVIERNRKPTPLTPTKLDFYFIKDGVYQDPYQVCSVHVFADTQYGTADQYLNLSAGATNYGLVSSVRGLVPKPGVLKARFQNINTTWTGPDAGIAACPVQSDYKGVDQSFNIFKVKDGHFAVILTPGGYYWTWGGGVDGAPYTGADALINADAFWPTTTTIDPVEPPFNSDPEVELGPFGGAFGGGFPGGAPNNSISTAYFQTCSGTGNNIDIWTVVDVIGSKAQCYINTFRLDHAQVQVVTEPLQISTKNELVTRYIEVGSKQQIRIKVFFTVDNEGVRAHVRNLLESGSLVTEPSFRIFKLNDSPEFTNRVLIKDFDDTEDNTVLTSDNTLSYNFDTKSITPKYSDDILGGSRGVYEVQARYTVVEQTFYTPKFKIIVR